MRPPTNTFSDPLLSLQDVEAAHHRLRGAIQFTPCDQSTALSELVGCRVYCKREYLQRTGSFKERGARNALSLLTPGERTRGVIAASAGNHALGLSCHGRDLSIPVTVVMPRYAPLSKVTACRRFGARVVLEGETFDQAGRHAEDLAHRENLVYIHPFDDSRVMAGQGTVALEVVEQVPDLDAVVVPVGGGGLLAGVATVLRALKPDVRIIGVEPANAACFSAAWTHHHPVTVQTRFTVADGLAVAQAGTQTFATAFPLVDRVLTVSEEALALAILRLAELEKAVVEGAGAAPLAALLSGALPELAGQNVVLLLTGGNVDPLTLGRIIAKSLAADGRIYRFNALISDRPGGLAGLSAMLAGVEANVTEIVHNRTFAGPDLSLVQVLCTVETRDHRHIAEINRRLAAGGLQLVPSPV